MIYTEKSNGLYGMKTKYGLPLFLISTHYKFFIHHNLRNIVYLFVVKKIKKSKIENTERSIESES